MEPCTPIAVEPDMAICQTEIPLDRYEPLLRPYAEEYFQLPDRSPERVERWMDAYVSRALQQIAPMVGLYAHYYMSIPIARIVEKHGGKIGDSYQLARHAASQTDRVMFVVSAVHFMAETIALLAAPHQRVYITNPKAGCTLEMMAKEEAIVPAIKALQSRYGEDLAVVAYVNCSARLKAIAGRTGGAACTSSNVEQVIGWALGRSKKVFFLPDRNLGENAAAGLGLAGEEWLVWPHRGDVWLLPELQRLDRAKLIVWDGYCSVHTGIQPDDVRRCREAGYQVLVHPECVHSVAEASDGMGSTAWLWRRVLDSPTGSRFAIATEGHFVENLRQRAAARRITVAHVLDFRPPGPQVPGRACAMMTRASAPHLVGLLDLLPRGQAPPQNQVLPGDIVDEYTGVRKPLDTGARAELIQDARVALERMVEIVERGP